MQYATFGSVSSATHRTEDLLDAFAYELEYHVQRNADEWCSDEGRKQRDQYLTLVHEAREIDPDSEEASFLLNEELFDALNDFAPPYAYFGAHEGDGADFGFWPCFDAIEELPKIKDPNEAESMEEDCVFINDHGNVTVYNSKGEVIWDCV